MRKPTRLRRKMCLEIAEMLFDHFELDYTKFDVDEAAGLIDLNIPETYDEMIILDNEISNLDKGKPKPTKTKSIFDELKKELNLTPDVPLLSVLKSALERIKNK